MEINHVNNNPLNDIQNVQSSVHPQNVQRQNVNDEIQYHSNSYELDTNVSPRRSQLSNELNQFMHDISDAQVQLSTISVKNEILDNIASLSLKIDKSKTSEDINQQLQPSVLELIQKYDDLEQKDKINVDLDSSHKNSNLSQTLNEGSVNIQSINQAILEQKESNEQNKITISENIQDIKERAIETINSEIAKIEVQKPYQNIDFGKNVSDFSSSNINNIVGSVALTQANAIPVQAQKLLS